jgi:hypothetical protein
MVAAAFKLLLNNTPKQQKNMIALDLRYFLKLILEEMKKDITILFNI